MEQLQDDGSLDLDRKLNDVFSGRVVRKDLTKMMKEGANVPVYV
ncbi:MAG: anti-phage BREX system Lon protease BrxL, partial [Bacilli bacterium]